MLQRSNGKEEKGIRYPELLEDDWDKNVINSNVIQLSIIPQVKMSLSIYIRVFKMSDLESRVGYNREVKIEQVIQSNLRVPRRHILNRHLSAESEFRMKAQLFL